MPQGMGLLTNNQRGVWSVTELGETVTEDQIPTLRAEYIAANLKKGPKRKGAWADLLVNVPLWHRRVGRQGLDHWHLTKTHSDPFSSPGHPRQLRPQWGNRIRHIETGLHHIHELVIVASA
jgi:hypothetical protein